MICHEPVKRVSVIIPAYNEAERVGLTVTAVWQLPNVIEVIVVDDGSTDNTAEVAHNHGASAVIRLGRNYGKGTALMHGVKASHGDVLLFVDADLGLSAFNLEPLIQKVIDGDADMAIAAPIPKGGIGGFGLAKAVARLAIALAVGVVLKAPLCGQRAVRRELVERVGRFAYGFGVEVGFTIDAISCGARIVEVPLAFEHRYTGRTIRGFIHRGRQLLDILRASLPRLLSSKLRPL
ncbi:MAG: glycosyltransferase family 2 protein [Armatimonadetes bacterium]|nr:glycosyltransferase family 2 protein [Armatimonadota bacterium]